MHSARGAACLVQVVLILAKLSNLQRCHQIYVIVVLTECFGGHVRISAPAMIVTKVTTETEATFANNLNWVIRT